MTIIAICTLVLNAIVAVLLVGYGLWFKNVVKHQLGAKDATIETLNTKVYALEGDRAPAIAAEYRTMRDFAEVITEDKQELDAQIKRLTKAQKEGEKVHQVEKTISEIDGLMVASELIGHAFDSYGETLMSCAVFEPLAHQQVLEKVILDMLDAMHQIALEMKTRSASVRDTINCELGYSEGELDA